MSAPSAKATEVYPVVRGEANRFGRVREIPDERLACPGSLISLGAREGYPADSISGVLTMRLTAESILVAAAALTACAPKQAAPTCAVAQASSAASSQLVSGNTQFALDLIGPVTSAAQGNSFFSPYSISSALAMVSAGAAGETATQLWTTLGLPGSAADPTTAGVAFANLDCQVRGDGNSAGNQLNLANAVYGQQGFPFDPSYLKILGTDYGAPLQIEDFESDSAKAIQDINGWVSGQTEGKIPQLVSSADVNTGTRLLLVNAIYFKGSWRTRFDPSATQAQPFLANDTAETSVQTMSALVPDAGYATGDGFAIAELPYTGSDLAMDIVLPSGDGGLAALEAQLDGGAVLASLTALRVENLQMSLPRFQIAQTIGLIPVLEGLGIEDAFSSSADFSGIDGAHDLFVSSVIHEAVVEVDETGSTAAAATAVAVGTDAVQEPQSIPFVVDHPFLFFIRDVPSGTILFAGHVEDPSVIPAAN
jgi:serpin B